MSDVDPSAPIAARVAQVRERVATACARAGRPVEDVTVVAVGKTHPPHLLLQALQAGVVDLGENRVQELAAKAPHLPEARWHLVGPLQRNKAATAVATAALVHTVDRRALVDELARLAARTGSTQAVLVQVNVGDDPAKHGCTVAESAALVAYAAEQPHLDVQGLMTVPPLPPDGADPDAAARPHFARLRELRDEVAAHVPGCRELSMGMSADLEAAVAEGATLVRVGTAIFGPRGARPWRG